MHAYCGCATSSKPSIFTHMFVLIYLHLYIYIFVGLCVCVCQSCARLAAANSKTHNRKSRKTHIQMFMSAIKKGILSYFYLYARIMSGSIFAYHGVPRTSPQTVAATCYCVLHRGRLWPAAHVAAIVYLLNRCCGCCRRRRRRCLCRWHW